MFFGEVLREGNRGKDTMRNFGAVPFVVSQGEADFGAGVSGEGVADADDGVDGVL